VSLVWTAAFWKAAGERAIRTVAQVVLGFVGAVPVVLDRNLFDFNWNVVASVAVVAGIVSVLTSIVTTGVGTNGPSMTSAEHLEVSSANQYDH